MMFYKFKFKFIFCFAFVCLIASNSACSTCRFTDGVVRTTSLEEMTLTVTDSDSTSFDKVFIPNTVEVRNGVFEAVSTYIRPEEEVPEGLRNFSFFFRDTAIGTGSRIFDEPAGSTFQVSGAIPNEDGVDYFEIVPNPLSPDGSETWLPANYSGTVRITADDMVEFDLSFTDGIKTRQLFAVYQFQSFDVSRPAGNCD